MPSVPYEQPAPISKFLVEINGEQARINKAGLPEMEVQTAEMVNGGDPFIKKVVSGPAKSGELVLTRYIDDSAEDVLFRNLFKQTFNPTGPSQASAERTTIAVIKLNAAGSEVERRIYHDCFPTKWSKVEQDAASSDLETEEFTFAVDWWEVV